MSCTGAYLLPGWLEAQSCPVAIIERDPALCDTSLSRMGLDSTWPLRRAFKRARGRRWRFEDIWQEEKARELWAFLLPGIAFDSARYRLLCGFNVQPQDWTPNTDVLGEVIRKYGTRSVQHAMGRSSRSSNHRSGG